VVGAAIAAQLAEQIRRESPQLDEEIGRGDFGALRGWLRTAVHSQGARLPLGELVAQATGRPLTAAASLRHLERRYLEEPA
jgi:carboxypeptidase Taq